MRQEDERNNSALIIQCTVDDVISMFPNNPVSS